MGLRCIIGHDYGDPERAEDREENGDELVVTVREYVECQRCGHRKTLSENTEVRTNDAPAPAPDPDGAKTGPEKGTEPASAGDDAPLSGDGTSHPSIGGEAATGGDADEGVTADGTDEGVTASDGATGDDASGAAGGDSEHDDVTAAEDDGVILEGGVEDDGRDHGEWPDADESDDEGFDAEPSSGGPGDDVEFGGGLAPETTSGDADPGSEPTDTASGITRADPGPDPTSHQRPATPDAVLACPRCGYTTPTQESSLRPGDICPECGQGYLAERDE